jgi:hypothetical protein
LTSRPPSRILDVLKAGRRFRSPGVRKANRGQRSNIKSVRFWGKFRLSPPLDLRSRGVRQCLDRFSMRSSWACGILSQKITKARIMLPPGRCRERMKSLMFCRNASDKGCRCGTPTTGAPTMTARPLSETEIQVAVTACSLLTKTPPIQEVDVTRFPSSPATARAVRPGATVRPCAVARSSRIAADAARNRVTVPVTPSGTLQRTGD